MVRINGASDDLAELQIVKDGKEISSEEFTVLDHEPVVFEVVNDDEPGCSSGCFEFPAGLSLVSRPGANQRQAWICRIGGYLFPECDVEYATAIAITIPGESDVSVRLVSEAD